MFAFSLGAFPSQAQLPRRGTSALFLPVTRKEAEKGGGAGWLLFLSHLLALQRLDLSRAPFRLRPESWELWVAMVEGLGRRNCV